MRLLLVNDDGVQSPFLPAFAEAFSKVADVCVVVPAREQSWIGRAYSRHSLLEISQAQDLDGISRYTVNGTPSDCVNIALSHILKEKPDAVISGLNIGQNVGFPLLWSSGTFSAAAEGAAWGIPAFAFSMRLAPPYYDECRLQHRKISGELETIVKAASKHSADFAIKTLKEKKFADGEVINVNYPEYFCSSTEFKKCEPARVGAGKLYNKNADGKFFFKYAMGEKKDSVDKITDILCLDSACACYSSVNIYGNF